MNIHQTPEQRVSQLEAENLGLTNKLSDAESTIEELKGEIDDLKTEIKDIDDFGDDEIRREFEARGMVDSSEREWALLAEMIAAKETDKALDLLAELTEGSVSPAVAKMLVAGRSQEALF